MHDHQNLLAGQRRTLIAEEVRRRGGARVSDLTRLLGVSDMTVRRDLDVLSRQGVLRKVHGGAVLAGEGPAHEPGFDAKSALEPDAKLEIARAAASFVAPGAAVAIGGGTTTFAVARELLEVPRLTVVTNSVRVADLFHAAAARQGEEQRPTVVLTGGVRTPSDALVGPVADTAIGSLHFDVLFLGAHGIAARTGLSTPNLAEAETNRRLIDSARRVVVVADHTKWGISGLSSFAALDRMEVLVSDPGLSAEAREELARVGVDLVVAGGGSGAGGDAGGGEDGGRGGDGEDGGPEPRPGPDATG